MAYVYRHVRLDKNEPFYVGIGKTIARAYSSKNRSSHWEAIVNKSKYKVDILFRDVDYDKAKEKEIEFINLYGRADFKKGPLCNKTNGGDGCLGLIHTEESREKMGAPNRGKVISKEHREAISMFHTGKRHSEEYKIKMSNRMIGEKNHMYGTKRSDEAKLKTSLANRGDKNKAAKLSSKSVLDIRRKYSEGNVTHQQLASEFGISKSNITSVLNRKTWATI
jgi:antitoxin component HigA of HigAB toxin-antitoxin module